MTANPSPKPSAAAPQLPPNVTLYTPANPSATQSLLHARLFTRLTTTAATAPSRLPEALQNLPPSEEGAFCLAYRDGILIFDGAADDDDEELADRHHEHFRLVCLALKDAGVDLDVSGCVFDSPSVLQAGFQLDLLNEGTVIVIDLMAVDDEDDEDEDEDEEATEAKLGALLGGGSAANKS